MAGTATATESAQEPQIEKELYSEYGGRKTLDWYRCPVDKKELRALYERSDWKGALQTGGHLGLLAITGTAACLAPGRIPWPFIPLLLWLHGTFYVFLLNGFHELCHNSVFKTKALNTIFLRVFSFLGMYNYVAFTASHTRHHQYTLHPPDDSEVVLPIKLTLKAFWQGAFFNPRQIWWSWKGTIRIACNRLEGDWEKTLFEPAPEKRRRLVRWSRVLLVGHTAILAVSIYFHWWMLPLVTTFAPSFGGWLLFLCNNTQHVGLKDNVPDFRLCCRTVLLNPFVEFVYWHMNYHTEHHMLAAVPCYHLGRLHKLIKHDMPHCPNGLVEAWTQISTILKRQKTEPTYQYVPDLP